MSLYGWHTRNIHIEPCSVCDSNVGEKCKVISQRSKNLGNYVNYTHEIENSVRSDTPVKCPKCGNDCPPSSIRQYKMCKYCYVKEFSEE